MNTDIRLGDCGRVQRGFLGAMVRNFREGKRLHIVEARHNGQIVVGPRFVTTDLNSHATAVVYFRRVFGRSPNKYSWGKSFMAEAVDRSGRVVEVLPVHHDELHRFAR